MSNVMEFDVDGRYLMGFMGSGKGSSFLTELGPIMSKKITGRVMSNMQVDIAASDPTADGSARKIVREVCNDD